MPSPTVKRPAGLWQIEDEVNALAVDNLNASAICDALTDRITRAAPPTPVSASSSSMRLFKTGR